MAKNHAVKRRRICSNNYISIQLCLIDVTPDVEGKEFNSDLSIIVRGGKGCSVEPWTILTRGCFLENIA